MEMDDLLEMEEGNTEDLRITAMEVPAEDMEVIIIQPPKGVTLGDKYETRDLTMSSELRQKVLKWQALLPERQSTILLRQTPSNLQ